MSVALRRPELDRTAVAREPASQLDETQAVPATATLRPAPASAPPRPREHPLGVAHAPADRRRAWVLIAAIAVALLLVAAIVWRPGSAPTNAPARPSRTATPTTAPIPSQLDDALKRLEQAVRP
jgi:hypothetical protein